MRVAIAGAGDLSRYIVEELLKASHEVVLLSRSEKEWCTQQKITLRVTDYTLSTLTRQLEDCSALISCIADYSMENATLHLTLLEACKQSSKCKRFIPSEFAANLDAFPDQPAFYVPGHAPVRTALAQQSAIMYTLFNMGWLMDYLVPVSQRYQKDIGIFHPLDLTANLLAIPGTGDEPVTFTAARDSARAIAALIDQPNWERTTYVAGETTTWNKVYQQLRTRGTCLKKSYRSANQLAEEISTGSEEEALCAQYDEWTISGGAAMPTEKVARQKEAYFKHLHFQDVQEFLSNAARSAPGTAL